MKRLIWISIAWILGSSFLWGAPVLLIAVSSSFEPTVQQLQPLFEAQTGILLQITAASTGQLTAQIEYGAPFDVFLSADKMHVDRLTKEGLLQEKTTTMFAIGKLVLYFLNGEPHLNRLLDPHIKTIAIANPVIAPYGLASEQVLKKQRIFEIIRSKMVWGQSTGQVASFVMSGHVDAAFLAQSQWIAMQRLKTHPAGQILVLNPKDYDPIRHYASILKTSLHPEIALQLIQFLKTKKARTLMQANGYQMMTA